ncbi:Solute carrier family 35 member D3 [Labeo rohita]|uniref:Solute carrier family 35 member D3 n=1 Tax=Labeo rohita TaxID=84645 RepID=A0ABQ8LUF1_LABRO|nr:Solute carrier family 35 member D3 [Labeo rohita]
MDPWQNLVSRCSAWWQMHTPHALRACVYEVCKPLVPLLLGIAALVAVIVYALADNLHSFVSRLFIAQYHYPYTVPLAFIQVLLNLLALLALHGVGLIHLKPFSLKLAERLFVPAVCGSVQCILAIWAEACSHSGLYQLIASFLPMVSLSLGHLFALTKVSQTERGHASTFDLYYTLTVTRTLLLGFLCVLHPDGPKALINGNWHSLLFLGYMLGMLLLGAVQLLFVDVTALYFSALPAAVLHATRELVLPLFRLL